ncbi:MAG: hypothetical protein GX427_05510 [Actinomycetales bacterium]|nr:hypothetical protein [Actinomycetales bacterium]
MRIYIPATARDLGTDPLRPQQVHAVTAGLRAALPDEDEEILELVALLAAADDSVRLIGERGEVPRRVVLAADVEAGSLAEAPAEAIESALLAPQGVPWAAVVSLHVDEDAARDEIGAAAAGDGDAFERSGERDLLWFDVTEWQHVADELRAG